MSELLDAGLFDRELLDTEVDTELLDRELLDDEEDSAGPVLLPSGEFIGAPPQLTKLSRRKPNKQILAQVNRSIRINLFSL